VTLKGHYQNIITNDQDQDADTGTFKRNFYQCGIGKFMNFADNLKLSMYFYEIIEGGMTR